MKCPPAFFAALKHLWPFGCRADTHTSPQISADACPTVQRMRMQHLPDAIRQHPWSGLPMTQRAAEWAAVRHLDENAARRRAVIEENRKALEKTLGKGACSND
jgi:hypothetical protein